MENTFICEGCGTKYTMIELCDYDGICGECGGEIPKNKEEYKKELEEEIEAMECSGNEDYHAYSERF